MTNEEVINTLNEMWERLFTEMRGWIFEDLKKEGKLDKFKEAHDMAIKIIEQMSFINKPCVSGGACQQHTEYVLDKIRAEIEYIAKDYDKFEDLRRVRGLWIAIEIIDKYRAGSEK